MRQRNVSMANYVTYAMNRYYQAFIRSSFTGIGHSELLIQPI